jgi:hypothetical protein
MWSETLLDFLAEKFSDAIELARKDGYELGDPWNLLRASKGASPFVTTANQLSAMIQERDERPASAELALFTLMVLSDFYIRFHAVSKPEEMVALAFMSGVALGNVEGVAAGWKLGVFDAAELRQILKERQSAAAIKTGARRVERWHALAEVFWKEAVDANPSAQTKAIVLLVQDRLKARGVSKSVRAIQRWRAKQR